jgi:hypothetical protein
MNRITLSSGLFCLIAASLTAFLLSCEDDGNDLNEISRPDRDSAHIRIIHANPNQSAISVAFSYLNEQNLIIESFSYGQAFPDSLYLLHEATLPEDTAQEYPLLKIHAHDPNDSTELRNRTNRFPARQLELDSLQNYSIWVADSLGLSRWLIVEDPPLAYPADTVSNVRYVNLASDPDRGFVSKVVSANSNLYDSDLQEFGETSSYDNIPNGRYKFYVRDQEKNVLDSLTYTVQPQTSYTVYYDDQALQILPMD